MLPRLPLSTRILVLGALIALCFSCELTWLYVKVRDSAFQSHRESTKQLVQAAWGVVDYYGDLSRKGSLGVPQAQEAARKSLKRLRYKGNDYFWINDLTPRMIMHPTNSALDGKDLSDYRDPTGLRLFVEMARICEERGEGSLDYRWAKPGAPDPVDKTSYVKLYKPWGWVVGTGVYVDDIEAELRAITFVLIGAAALMFSLAVFLSFLMARSIARAIGQTTEKLLKGGDKVAAAAVLVASVSEVLAQSAIEQGACLEETAASSQQIASVTNRNADGARTAAAHMAETSQAVDDANRRLTEMTDSMQALRGASGKVAAILKVIEEIAFQTNLLALNAAVEAARAGQAGAGFAVVADEVRSLAQRCTQAAKETEALVQESIARSNEGGDKLEAVSQAIAGITAGSTKMRVVVDEVHLGSDEQRRGIEQIMAAIAQMNRMIHGMAARAQEGASASHAMSGEAAGMRNIVGELQTLISGSRGQAAR